ncbi:MAG: protein tyrosine kinase [Chloroflexota bacterium]
MDLRKYWTILWRWSWLITLGTLLAAGTAFIVSRNMTPVYSASVTLLVNQAPRSGLTDYASILTSQQLAKTYSELLHKRPVLEAAIEKLNLPLDPAELARAVSVDLIRDTQLIVLNVENTSPEQAAALANTIAEVFIAQNAAQQTSRFASSKESLSKEIAAVQASLAQTQAALDALGEPDTPEEQAQKTQLETSLAQYRTSYANLLQSYENIRAAEAQELNNVSVVEPAVPPRAPIRPRVELNTLLAGLVGMVLAGAIAYVFEYLDDTLKSPEDISQRLGLWTLAAIGRIEGKTAQDRLVTLSAPRSPIAEAYRLLRTNFQFAAVDRPLRRIVVTSPGPGDGKSTTAANLAVVFAQGGKSVILVDADLRRPQQHRIFQRTASYGLSTALVDAATPVTSFLQPTDVPGLRLLTSGPIPPNPAELLGSQRMAQLLQVLSQEAEMVILDSPPVLSVADATILANAADGVVLVADAGRTRREMARRAKESLERAGANLLGMVLNRMTRQTSGYYYYYYYDQSGERSKRRRRQLPWWQVWRRLRKRLHRQPGEATEATETLVGANGA